jgi:hypothetical protein
MGFLDNYEASRERLERWNRTFPDGRIETRIVEFSAEKGYVLVEAKAYKNSESLVPAGIDFAYGYQGAYQQNMKRWFVEDSVTSAIMRVQQLVMGGAESAARVKSWNRSKKLQRALQTWTPKTIGQPNLETCQVSKRRLKPNRLAFRH